MTALELAELVAAALRDVDDLAVDVPRPDGQLVATVRVRARESGLRVTVEQDGPSSPARGGASPAGATLRASALLPGVSRHRSRFRVRVQFAPGLRVVETFATADEANARVLELRRMRDAGSRDASPSGSARELAPTANAERSADGAEVLGDLAPLEHPRPPA